MAITITTSLPSTYQEVEYIYNTSNGPYINTGCYPYITTKTQLKFMNLASTGDCIYGHQGTSDSNDYRLFNGSNKIYFDFNNSRIEGGTLSPNTVYEFELGNYYVRNIPTRTNLLSTTPISTYGSPDTIYLNGKGVSQNRWYYVKIWTGDSLSRYLIPCYRKSDNIIGMYDLVQGRFYTNSGSGSFSKGSDVTNNAYKLNLMDVFISSKDVSEMRGPCASGYHVMRYADIVSLWSAGTSRGLRSSSSPANMGVYYKMPKAGARAATSGNVAGQGTYANYWECDGFGTGANLQQRYYMRYTDTAFAYTYITGTTYACSIRPVKDVPVEPDSTWTTLYNAGDGNGIFWKSASGLITMKRSNTIITIADKNLGATTVWNSGDALSAANCGNYYQWGNNYGFPRTGTVTTSSVQIDASAYGYGNWYSSSTFRTTSPRDLSNNRGLWGAGKPCKHIYVGSNLIRPYKKYTPTSSTLSYLPMRKDTQFTDYGSLNWTWTQSGTGGTFVDNYRHSAGNMLQTGYNTYSTYGSYTILCWVRTPYSKTLGVVLNNYGNGDNGNITLEYNLFNRYNGNNGNISFTSIADNRWHLLAITGANGVGYVDGIQVGTNTRSVSVKPYMVGINGWRLNQPAGGNCIGDYSDFIFENRVRTAAEILNHYNTYKGNYGIS